MRYGEDRKPAGCDEMMSMMRRRSTRLNRDVLLLGGANPSRLRVSARDENQKAGWDESEGEAAAV